MAQGQPSGFSSKLRFGGRALLYAQPVSRSATFRPSGDPEHDPPERVKETEDEQTRRSLGLDTPEGRDAWDAKLDAEYLRHNALHWHYWEQRRFLQNKSPRAKKRALARMAKRDQYSRCPR